MVCGHGTTTTLEEEAMSFNLDTLDEHIEKLRGGDTLTENEVRALCEKVRRGETENWIWM